MHKFTSYKSMAAQALGSPSGTMYFSSGVLGMIFPVYLLTYPVSPEFCLSGIIMLSISL